MIYAKENPIPLTHNRYEQSFEYMFVLSKGKPKTFNPLKDKCVTNGSYNHRRNTGRVAEAATRNRDEKTYVKADKFRINMWYYTVGNNEDTTKHPAPFPEQLAADQPLCHFLQSNHKPNLLHCSSYKYKMAHKLKRNWILSEISSEYVQISEKRIAPYHKCYGLAISVSPLLLFYAVYFSKNMQLFFGRLLEHQKN